MSDGTSGTTSKTEPKTDWRRVRSMTDEEVHAAIIDDPDAQPTDEAFWKEARVVMPRRKDSALVFSSTLKLPCVTATTASLGSCPPIVRAASFPTWARSSPVAALKPLMVPSGGSSCQVGLTFTAAGVGNYTGTATIPSSMLNQSRT